MRSAFRFGWARRSFSSHRGPWASPRAARSAAKPAAKPRAGMQMDPTMQQQMMEQMKKMPAQMDRIHQTTDPKERDKLMAKHMKSLQEGMQMMRGNALQRRFGT